MRHKELDWELFRGGRSCAAASGTHQERGHQDRDEEGDVGAYVYAQRWQAGQVVQHGAADPADVDGVEIEVAPVVVGGSGTCRQGSNSSGVSALLCPQWGMRA